MDVPFPDLDALLPRAPKDAPTPKRRNYSLLIQIVIGASAGVLFSVFMPGWTRDLSLAQLVLFLVLLFAFGWLHVVLHELGHAITGALAGMELVSLSIFGLRFEHDGESWRCRYGGSSAGISGFALMAPRPGAPIGRGRVVAFVLGGPLANLALAAPAVAYWLHPGSSGTSLLIAQTFAFTGLLFGLGNLLPLWTGGWRSDGGRLLDIWRDPDAVALGFSALRVMRASRAGQRPRHWTNQDLPPWSEIKHLQSRALMPAAAHNLLRALDQNDAQVADECARHLADHWQELNAPERSGVALIMAMYSVRRRLPVAAARAWQSEFGAHALDLSAYRAWLDAEIALGERRVESVPILIQAAREKLHTIIDRGSRHVLEEYLAELASRAAKEAATPQAVSAGI